MRHPPHASIDAAPVRRRTRLILKGLTTPGGPPPNGSRESVTPPRRKARNMQVPAPFEYERAASVEHAIGLLSRLGSTARLVAGGHSLLPMMKLRLANFEYLIDINDLHRELGYIRVEPTRIRIGAMTRHRELLESAELRRWFPIFHDAERVIADPLVRNRGTTGGALCHAAPAAALPGRVPPPDATR